MSKNAPDPLITVRLIGVLPEDVTLKQMSKLVAKLQRLLAVDLRLLNVRRTSAAYDLYPTQGYNPNGIIELIERSKKAIDDPINSLNAAIMHCYDDIAPILRKLGCKLQLKSALTDAVVELDFDLWQRVRKGQIIHDEAVLAGKLMRVGGTTRRRCAIRLPGRTTLIYCTIPSTGMSQELARHLYSEVVFNGTGEFFAKDWSLLRFHIEDFHISRDIPFDESYERIRAHGGKGWDDVDPSKFIEDMR